MKLLVISHMYPNDYNKNSGIFIHKQVKALKKNYGEEINIKVVSPVPYTPFLLSLISQKYKKYYNIPEKLDYEGIEVYYPRVLLLPKNLNFKSSGKALYKGMNRLVEKINRDFKFDLIHAHVALPDGESALLLNKKYNKPIITTIHGQDMNYTVNLNDDYKEKVINVIEKSDKIVFVSNKLRKEAEKYTNKTSNFEVISNGISIEDIKKQYNDEIKEEFTNKKYILVVGNLLKTKGMHYAIEAFSEIHKKYDDYIMIIIGRGPERENLERLCKDRGVEDKIIFKGQVPNGKVMEYMNYCEFFVLPSYKEGFGVVYIEAMAHGKTVIGCKGEGIQDVIENLKDGILVLPQDKDDLRNKMELLITDSELRESIGVNAKKKILSNYTWDNNAVKNYQLYEELLNKFYGGK